MKVIIAITIAITIGLLVSRQLPKNGGTVHTMDSPSMIIKPTV